MLSVDSLSYTYKGSTVPVVTNLSFEALKNEIVLLKGSNGSGKSTIINILGKLLKPQKGTKIVLTENETVGVVFQDPSVQILFDTVEEDIGFVLENYNVPNEQWSGRIENALELVDLFGKEKENPKHFSIGQKQRVAIAGMLALKPQLLLLDEPTAMLDPDGKIAVRRIIQELAEQGKIIVIASNDPEDFSIATKVISL
jgi:energy-coupling factor transporter ATP-binding protein EcfA2